MAKLEYITQHNKIVIPSLSYKEDEYTRGLQVYCVGGAVRDALLGLAEGDRDWVVVGSTPEEMLSRKFTPVGGDFPVFLHPITKAEYALARTERKSGRGYQGFTFYTGSDVTLEEDLCRRDFTVNAMAVDAQGILYDPYHGLADLEHQLFRHVSKAFIEDPVRILRLGRFLSRFEHFKVADETLKLCYEMVSNGEVDALVPERIWKEVSRTLMCSKPSRFFKFLYQIDGLERVLPEFKWRDTLMLYLDNISIKKFNLLQRYALLVYLGNTHALSTYLHVSREQADYAKCLPIAYEALRELPVNLACLSVSVASSVVRLIEQLDGIRKSERLLALVQVVNVLLNINSEHYVKQWSTIIDVVKAVPAGTIARQHAPDTQAIRIAVHQARVSAVANL